MIVLSGCASQKVKYEDLPKDMQIKIQSAIKKDLFTPYLEKTSEMITLSWIDQKQVIDDNTKKL